LAVAQDNNNGRDYDNDGKEKVAGKERIKNKQESNKAVKNVPAPAFLMFIIFRHRPADILRFQFLGFFPIFRHILGLTILGLSYIFIIAQNKKARKQKNKKAI